MDKKYNIIYADPPWDYGNTKNLNGKFCGIADRHYNVMKFQDICCLPVQNIAGFKYATVGFVWIKMKNDMSCVREDGLGKYTISNAEYCLIARKGKYWRESRDIKQVIQYPKTAHSSKPPEIRERIVSLCGDLPRIELFARDLCPGWDSIGNEIDGRDIRDVIK